MHQVKSSLKSFLLVAATVMLCVAPSMADTLVIGNGGLGNRFPFGIQAVPPPTTTPNYQPGATYQQIYNGDPFGGSVLITQIAFASRATTNGVPGTANYNFTVQLGTSATSAGAASSSFAANRTGNLTNVFSGALSATLTLTNTFDLAINFTTPFLYDPSQGDLLLDVTFNQLATFTGGNLFFDQGTSPDTSRVFNVLPSATGTVNQTSGLRTRFTFTPLQTQTVPEPATMILLGTGLAGVVAKVRCRRRRQSDEQA